MSSLNQNDYNSNIKEQYNRKSNTNNYDKDITIFTYKHHDLTYPVFTNVIKRKLIILKYPDYNEIYISMNSDNLSSQEAWNVLNQRIEVYKQKNDEEIKAIKHKEIEKLDINKAKPNELEKKNIEDLPGNKELKNNIKEEIDANKKEIIENKPNLIIKVSKPYAMGYFNINLSSLLNGLLGVLSAFALGLVMSKIADQLKSLLSFSMNTKSKINTSEINKALNSININNVIKEAVNEENVMNLNKTLKNNGLTSDLNFSRTSSETLYDTQSSVDDTGTYSNDDVDVVFDNTIDKKDNNGITKTNKKKEIYTINKRGRKDLLNSQEVNDRLNNNNNNKRMINNPNYGKYW